MTTLAEEAGLVTIGREDFIRDYWDYRAGDHVTIVAPTDYGKTWFVNDLLAVTATQQLPAVTLATKPRDRTVDRLVAMGHRKVTAYPPRGLGQVVTTWGEAKPPGWVVWPRHVGDPLVDDANHRAVFRRAMLHDYGRNAAHKRFNRRRGIRPIILNLDEIYSITVDLKMEREARTLWAKGRSVGIGVWGGTQRPYDIPQHAYSQPQHVFLGYTPDRRDRQRFREISGVDPDLVMGVTFQLQWRQWLYINRKHRTMAVVDA
jgi:hypothetical protein